MGTETSFEFRGDTSNLQRGLEGARAGFQALGDKAAATARQFDELNKSATAALQPLATNLASAGKTAFDGLSSSVQIAAGQLQNLSSIWDGLNKSISSGGATSLGGGNALGLLLAGGTAGAVASGGMALLSFLHKTNEEIKSLASNADRAGMSLEEFQRWQYAAGASGMSGDKFVSGIIAMNKAVNDMNYKDTDLSKWLDKNKVQWKDEGDNIYSAAKMLEVFVALAKERSGNTAESEKLAEMFKLPAEFVQMAVQGNAALADLRSQAAPLGDEFVAAASRTAREWDQTWFKMSAGIKSFVLQEIGNVQEKIRATTSELKWLGDAGAALMRTFSSDYKEGSFWKDLHKGTETGGATNVPAGGGMSTSYRATDLKTLSGGTGLNIGKGDLDFGDEDKHLDERRAAMLRLAEAVRQASHEYQKQTMIINQGMQLHEFSEQTKAKLTIDAIAREEAVQVAAVNKELATLRGFGEVKQADQQRLQNRLSEIHSQGELKRMKIGMEETASYQKEWEGVLGQIQNAWDSQLEKLITKAETWKKAMQNIAKTLVMEWIKEFEKAAMAKLAAGLATAGLTPGQGGIGGAIFSMIPGVGGGLATAAMTANTTALGLLTAQLVELNASMVIRNVEGAIPGFAVGAWEIPSTMAGVLHPGEMIVPEGPAEALRSGAGIGGGSVTFSPTINAIDARSVQAFMSDYAPQMAVAVAQHQKKNRGTFG